MSRSRLARALKLGALTFAELQPGLCSLDEVA